LHFFLFPAAVTEAELSRKKFTESQNLERSHPAVKKLAAEPLPTGTLNCCFEYQSVLSRLLSVFTNSTIFLFITYSLIFFV